MKSSLSLVSVHGYKYVKTNGIVSTLLTFKLVTTRKTMKLFDKLVIEASKFVANICTLQVVIKDESAFDTVTSLANFQPLSVAKANIFSSTTRVLQKDSSVTKSMPFKLKRSRCKLRSVDSS